MYNNVVSTGSIKVIFQILSFAIQKDLAAQSIIRLAFIHM
jgi:hypothetical protein